MQSLPLFESLSRRPTVDWIKANTRFHGQGSEALCYEHNGLIYRIQQDHYCGLAKSISNIHPYPDFLCKIYDAWDEFEEGDIYRDHPTSVIVMEKLKPIRWEKESEDLNRIFDDNDFDTFMMAVDEAPAEYKAHPLVIAIKKAFEYFDTEYLDIHWSNIMMDDQGNIKLIDWF